MCLVQDLFITSVHASKYNTLYMYQVNLTARIHES